jgi:hypothetical protein
MGILLGVALWSQNGAGSKSSFTSDESEKEKEMVGTQGIEPQTSTV